MANVELTLKAKTVDLAVEAAMLELGIDDRDQLAVEVLQEPKKGPKVFGGQDAVVTVRRKRSRRRRSGRGKQGNSKKGAQRTPRNENQQRREQKSAKNGTSKQNQRRPKTQNKTERPVSDDRPTVSIEEQAAIAKDFLEGLVDAYGLEGDVDTRVDDEVIIADVSGEQTEALVGVRGSVRSAIHELTRTVLQRYAQDTARLRLDIAGYGERRRQALAIYAEQLIEQLVSEGGEIMLEPMSPADRKVIHDVASAHERVSSYSEGEPPRRFVVLSLEESGEEE